jgi:NAD(P)-dependent dehydrogenase (short-subunit alcohol dehydrogenase family)
MAANYPFSVVENEFQGKRVLVTGGTKGMGEAFVRRLTLGGAWVATTARSPFPEGQQPALFVQADIGTADGVQAVVDRLLKDWGGIDITIAWEDRALPMVASKCSWRRNGRTR